MNAPTDTPLRLARKEAQLTMTELAAAVGADQSTISRIELRSQRASPELAAKIAARLGNISEMEILYPERYVEPDESDASGCSGAAA